MEQSCKSSRGPDDKDSLIGTQGEILAILKLMEVLLLTSVGLGFLQQLLKPKETLLIS